MNEYDQKSQIRLRTFQFTVHWLYKFPYSLSLKQLILHAFENTEYIQCSLVSGNFSFCQEEIIDESLKQYLLKSFMLNILVNFCLKAEGVKSNRGIKS